MVCRIWRRRRHTKAETITKLKPGLCDAKLMWDHKKAASYIERLKKKGYAATAVLVTAMGHDTR